MRTLLKSSGRIGTSFGTAFCLLMVIALSPIDLHAQFHGVSIQKLPVGPDGTSRAHVGDTITASIRVRHLDDFEDTIVITSIVDVVHHSMGANNVTSSNLLASPVTLSSFGDSVTRTNLYPVLPGDGDRLLDDAQAGGIDLHDGIDATFVEQDFFVTFPGQIQIFRPSISVTKNCVLTGTPDNPMVSYSGIVSNTGNCTLTNVIVIDNNGTPENLADDVQYFIGTLATNSSAPYGGVYIASRNPSTNTVIARGTDELKLTVTNTANCTVEIPCEPGISVTKVCPAAPVVPGGVLAFSGVVSNTGNVTLTNVIVVNDQPGPGTIVFGPVTLAPGVALPFTGSYTVPALVTNCTLTDTLTATAGVLSICGGTVSNSASASCTVALGAIGDFVWEDLNYDGCQGTNEPGIANVTVELLDCSTNLIASTSTGPNGEYFFSDLCPGNYTVRFVEPSGYQFTKQNACGNNATDSDPDPQTGRTTCININAGETNTTVDGGLFRNGCLGDYVWEDVNRDGIQNEPASNGVPNVIVQLFECSSTNVLQTTTTDNTGHYLFCDLVPGAYRVQIVVPGGYVITQQNQGTNDCADSDANANGLTDCATVTSGSTNRCTDIGIRTQTGCLGDYVWEDTNHDGIQNEMPAIGVTNVIVQLLECGSTNVLQTTITDSTGRYLFCDLIPGLYQVQIVLPGGYVITRQNQGTNDCADSDASANGLTDCVTVLPGVTNDCTDIGLVRPAAIGDFAFNDLNHDGIQNEANSGLAGVTVQLLDCTNGVVLATTNTAADGSYLFANLTPGTYRIRFIGPGGLLFTLSDVGNDALDSDAGTNGLTGCYTLVSGETNRTVDAGFFQDVPCFTISKKANQSIVSPFQPVRYTYGVTNCGFTILTNIVVSDDNGTPDYGGDDLIVGTVAQLNPGQHVTLERTLYLPVQLCDSNLMNPSGLVIIVTPTNNGNFAATFIQSFGVNDNTYGTNSYGWPLPRGHRFSDLTASDHAQWHFRNADGELVLAFNQDYITAASTNLFPSGYGCLGLSGDGGILLGNPTNILYFNTSFTDNLNKEPFLSNLAYYTVNSPASNSPHASLWEYRMIYQVIIHKDVFGPSGFGSATITDQHNSPAKQLVVPVYCGQCVTNLATGVASFGTNQLTATASASVCVNTDPFAAIGDFVWNDLNADGRQDAGEPGLAGVEVSLFDCSSNLLATATTSASGKYLFNGLLAGNYTVRFTAPQGLTFTGRDAGLDDQDSDADSSGLTVCIPLATSQTNLTVDAGFADPNRPQLVFAKRASRTAVVAGSPVTYLYGVTNVGGTVLSNIVVTDDNGTPSVTSDDFIAGTIALLAPGQGAMLQSTRTLAQNVCMVINNTNREVGSIVTRALPNGDIEVTYSQSRSVVDNTYGTNRVGYPGDHRFNDLTGQDRAQFIFSNQLGQLVLDVDVDYLSASGTFPSGFGSLGVSGGDGKVNSGSASNVVSATTSLSRNLNQSPAFHGYTANSPAPESAFPTWDYVSSFTIVVRSNAFGASGFGSVSVPFIRNSPSKISGLTDFQPSPCNSCVTNLATVTASSGNVALSAYSSASVCLVPGPGASLGNFVWLDGNTNGVQDLGESGVSNVVVELQSCAGATVDIALTDSNGQYLFADLPAGSYRVRFVPAAGLLFTTSGVGGNASLDSDVDPVTGLSGCVTLSAGQINLAVDAGVFSSIVNPLPLSIVRSNGSLTISWPASGGFILEYADLVIGPWAPLVGTPVEVNGQKIVTIPIDPARDQRYFRLRAGP